MLFRWDWSINPGGTALTKTPTPLGGGIGIWLGIIVTFASGTLAVAIARHSDAWSGYIPDGILPYLDGIWGRVGQIWLLLAAGTVLFVLGICDDRRGVHVGIRLAVEFAVAAFVVYGLGLWA